MEFRFLKFLTQTFLLEFSYRIYCEISYTIFWGIIYGILFPNFLNEI